MSGICSLHDVYRRHIYVPLMIVASTVMLGFGLSLPLMKVEKMVFWKNQYSVINGIVELYKHQDYVLSGVLFFFCLIFPIVKLMMLWIVWDIKLDASHRSVLLKWLGILGKWSMLDVFVVAILIVLVKLGPLARTEPQPGVYVFCGAIISSMVTAMLIEALASRVDHHN